MGLRFGKTSNNGSYLSVTDYRDLIKEVRRIEPTLIRGLKSNYREIAKPVQQAVRKGIPNKPVLSGMTPKVIPGRLTWGTGKPAKSVLIQTPAVKASRKGMQSIARVRTQSAAVGVADMAGRSRGSVGKYPKTREYPYSRSKSGTRSHKLTRENGMKFIRNLNDGKGVTKREASRMVWPNAEKAIPQAQGRMKVVLESTYNYINSRMKNG